MNREEAIERMKTMRWEHATNPCPDRDAFDMAISALSENKTFKGLTNGEVIKALFPKAEIYVDEWKGLKSVVVWFEDAKVPHTFVYEWWNAPYKAESEDEPE